MGPEFWAEPLNALSNGAFVLAALYGISLAKKRGGSDLWEKITLGLALLIGPGSFLFHTFANSWSERADVLPIWGFVAAYTALAIYRSTDQDTARFLRIAGITTLIIGMVFYVTSGDVTTQDTAPPRFNGSLQYLPAVIALLVFAAICWVRNHPARRLILAAACTFLISLGFRTFDMSTCATTQIGTHFVWHILNATMIALLLKTLIQFMPPRTRPLGDTS